MSKSQEEEQTRWDQVMQQFDLLFTQVNNISVVQQQLKTQMDIRGAAMDQYSAEQHMIAQQVKANGQAVAQLTMKAFEKEAHYDDSEEVSVVFEEEPPFQNIFAKNKDPHKPALSHKPKTSQKAEPFHKPEPSKNKPFHKPDSREHTTHQAMPKMQFPSFDGTKPKVWKDKCKNYFELYKLPEGMWITAATLHFHDNAAMWF